MNMLLQDPRPLEEKRDELAQVGAQQANHHRDLQSWRTALTDKAAHLSSCEWKACA